MRVYHSTSPRCGCSLLLASTPKRKTDSRTAQHSTISEKGQASFFTSRLPKGEITIGYHSSVCSTFKESAPVPGLRMKNGVYQTSHHCLPNLCTSCKQRQCRCEAPRDCSCGSYLTPGRPCIHQQGQGVDVEWLSHPQNPPSKPGQGFSCMCSHIPNLMVRSWPCVVAGKPIRGWWEK